MSGHRFLRLSIVVAALVAAAMASAGTTTYTVNALDQVTAVSGPGGSASYSYDGDGQRIKRTAGGQTVIYLRDPSGEVIAEYSSNGTLLAEYVYVDGKRLCKITKDTEGGEHRVYYHSDVVGTSVALTSETGTVTATAQNRPFGEQVGAPLPDSHAFTGKELDPETGLNYFGARYYDAHLGRFISIDPVGGKNEDPQSWNRYAYSLNNPLRFLDPDGKDVVLVARNNAGGGIANFGHTALRVFGPGYDVTYDFGRYAGGTGFLKAKGPGILRVWSDYSAFLKGQAPEGDLRTLTYKTSKASDEAIMAVFSAQIAEGSERPGRVGFKEYQLAADYDLTKNNCTTISVGAMGEAQEKSGFEFPGYKAFQGMYDPRDLYKATSSARGEGVTYRDLKEDSK